jgi:hypothetical protein
VEGFSVKGDVFIGRRLGFGQANSVREVSAEKVRIHHPGIGLSNRDSLCPGGPGAEQ